MPVDVLKIDRTFVRDVNSDVQSASMVSAIIALASNLQMDPLAEGIETEEEWRFLAARGCASGQGFLFSRPVPAEEILAMHRRSRSDRRSTAASPSERHFRFGARNALRRPFGPPLNTTRGGATFMPSSSNSSWRSRRAAMRETSPC